MVRSTLFIFSVGSWKAKMVNQRVDVEEFPQLHVWGGFKENSHLSRESEEEVKTKKWRAASFLFVSEEELQPNLLMLQHFSGGELSFYFFFLLLLLPRSCETAELGKNSITLPPSQSQHQRWLSVTLRCQIVFHKHLKCNSAVKIHSKYSQYAQSSIVFPLFAEQEARNRFRLA